jgi:L-amino acid N-acyltransferase YncA
MNTIIRNVKSEDATAIADIYNHYTKNTIITFEEEEISESDIAERIKNVISNHLPWIVAETDGEIIGYSYAAEWNSRSAYRYTVESTIYLAPDKLGQGVGSMLYQELISRVKQADRHAVVGVIALPNPSSVSLHEKFGFKRVAYLKEVGTKFGKWVDVGNWQLLL